MRLSASTLAIGLIAMIMLPGDAVQDRYGDTLPDAAIQRLGSIQLKYGVSDLGYLPDGRAVLARGSSLEIWNLAIPERLAVQQPGGSIVSFDVNSDGHTLLLAISDDRVTEWDIEAEEAIRTWETEQSGLQYVTYSPDETRALTTGRIPPTINEWLLDTGQKLNSISGETMELFNHAVYLGDGKRAVVGGGYEDILAEYDLQTGEMLNNWFGNYVVYHLTLSPDRRRLAVGSRSMGTEWLVDGWEQLHRFTGHAGGAVNCVAYTPDGTEILTGSRDGSIRRWSTDSGEMVFRWFPHESYVRQIAVSPDGQNVLSYGAGLVAESDIETGESTLPFDRHTAGVGAVAMIDADTCVSGSADGTLKIWDIRSGECVRTIEGAKLGAYAVAISPDRQRVAAGCKDSVIRIFELATGDIVAEHDTHRGYVRSLEYGPDGRLFSTAGDGTLQIHGPDDEPVALEGHLGGVLDVAITADGSRAITGGRDGTVRLWDVESAIELAVFEGHRGWVESVVFAGDDVSAYSSGRDGRILKWDLQAEAMVAEMDHGAWVQTLALTPDGRMLCSGGEDNRVRCWNLLTMQEVAQLSGHDSTILSTTVTPDGRHLVTASADNTLLVWALPEIDG